MSHPGKMKSGGLPQKTAFEKATPKMQPPKGPDTRGGAVGKGGMHGGLSAAKASLTKQQKGCY